LLAGHYEKLVDRESAYELLKGRTEPAAPVAENSSAASAPAQTSGGGIGGMLGGIFGGGSPLGNSSRSNRAGLGEAFAKSAMRSIGSAVGREIIRGVLGSLFKK
jgi:hypothetical protein